MVVNKKGLDRFFVLVIFSLLLVSFASSFVVAADVSNQGSEAAETIVTGISGFFNTLLSPLFGDKEMLSRIFFALLLGMIVFSAINVFFKGSSDRIKWGITIAITALSLLALPTNFLEAVRTQYGAMGATILTIIPFAIILIFSMSFENLLLIRLTWIFYAMYYLFMYMYKIVTIYSSSDKNPFLNAEVLPYLGAFFVGIFVFFLIKDIRNLIFRGKLEGEMEKAKQSIAQRGAGLKAESERLALTGVSQGG